MTESDQLAVKIVRKLARNKVVGGHYKQVDTVRNWFATDEQGQVEDVIRDLIRDPDAPRGVRGKQRHSATHWDQGGEAVHRGERR